jgi:hypothetical protein
MKIVVHRINTIGLLKTIPLQYGCEIDIRAEGSKLILNHEPFATGDSLLDYLDAYSHGLLVLNIKEAGIESVVLEEVRKRGIKDYFLLDVEFPYLYRASRQGEKAIAVRYSEDEPIELVEAYKNKVDWVWIDTNTVLPLSASIIKKMDGMLTCLVCPERWGRPQDIIPYRRRMKELSFEPDAVMTGIQHLQAWQSPLH